MTYPNQTSDPLLKPDDSIAAVVGVLSAIALLVLVLWFVFSSADSAEAVTEMLSAVVL